MAIGDQERIVEEGSTLPPPPPFDPAAPSSGEIASPTVSDHTSGSSADPLAHYVNAISFIARLESEHTEAMQGADMSAYAQEEAAYQDRIGEMKQVAEGYFSAYTKALESPDLSSDNAAAKAAQVKDTVAAIMRKNPNANPQDIYAAVISGRDPDNLELAARSTGEESETETKTREQMLAVLEEAKRRKKPVYSIFGFVGGGVTSKPIRDADAVTGGLAFVKRMEELQLKYPDDPMYNFGIVDGKFSNGLTVNEQGQVLGVLTLVVQQNNSAASAINIGIHTLSAGGKEVIEALAAGGNAFDISKIDSLEGFGTEAKESAKAFLANMDEKSKQEFDYKVTHSEILRIGDDLWAILRDPNNTSYAAGNPKLTPEQLALLPAVVRDNLGKPPTLQKLATWPDPQFTNPDIAANYTGNLPKRADGSYDGVYIQGLGEYGWYTGTIGGYVSPDMTAKLPGTAADPAKRDADFKAAENDLAITSIKATAAAWDTNYDGSISIAEAEAHKNTPAFATIAQKMQNLGVLPAENEAITAAMIAGAFEKAANLPAR